MRKFGTDAPRFMSFTLGDDETVFNVPLAQCLPADTLVEMQEAAEAGETAALRYQVDLLARYIGKDRAAALTVGDVRAIFQAWGEESQEQGAAPGE